MLQLITFAMTFNLCGDACALQSVDPGQQFTWENSNLEVNKAKNRYANVIAYDHSRVVLASIDGTTTRTLHYTARVCVCVCLRVCVCVCVYEVAFSVTFLSCCTGLHVRLHSYSTMR